MGYFFPPRAQINKRGEKNETQTRSVQNKVGLLKTRQKKKEKQPHKILVNVFSPEVLLLVKLNSNAV